MTRDSDGYRVVPFAAVRHIYLDTLHLAYRKHDIHALLEIWSLTYRYCITSARNAGPAPVSTAQK